MIRSSTLLHNCCLNIRKGAQNIMLSRGSDQQKFYCACPSFIYIWRCYIKRRERQHKGWLSTVSLEISGRKFPRFTSRISFGILIRDVWKVLDFKQNKMIKFCGKQASAYTRTHVFRHIFHWNVVRESSLNKAAGHLEVRARLYDRWSGDKTISWPIAS
jgi:hypothetical protein